MIKRMNSLHLYIIHANIISRKYWDSHGINLLNIDYIIYKTNRRVYDFLISVEFHDLERFAFTIEIRRCKCGLMNSYQKVLNEN